MNCWDFLNVYFYREWTESKGFNIYPEDLVEIVSFALPSEVNRMQGLVLFVLIWNF